MSEESVQEFYNRQYALHREGRLLCPNALHDLAKASRRVDVVLRRFGIDLRQGAKALDVGSGLGYYTKALAVAGAQVTGIDFSESAISAARGTFPECEFRLASWPSDVATTPSYDLVWMANFSLMNTFDVGFIKEALIDQAMRRLVVGGSLVVGWNTNFSGRVVEGYSHWPFAMLKQLRSACGLSAPFVVEAHNSVGSWFVSRFARLVTRSIPVFLVRRKTAIDEAVEY